MRRRSTCTFSSTRSTSEHGLASRSVTMPELNSTFLGVEWRSWLTGGAIMLLVAIAHAALRWWSRRRTRKDNESPLAPGDSAKVRYWLARGLSDAVPPVAFMLWLHGLYFAVTTLLAEFPDTAWLSRGPTIL